MRKIIYNIEYDTEYSKLLGQMTCCEFGDPEGYEERLYETEDGKFFLYVNGGEKSPYTKENIKRMSAAKAQEWLKEHE